jgi:hypothetical protein
LGNPHGGEINHGVLTMCASDDDSIQFNHIRFIDGKLRMVWRTLRWTVRIMLISALWFAAVDWTSIYRQCAICHYSANVFEYRVFGVPVTSTIREYPSWLTRLATDMNAPCHHFRSYESLHQRWWGLIYCKQFGSGYGIGDDCRYTESVAARVRELAEDGELSDEFQYRLQERHDRAWLARISHT